MQSMFDAAGTVPVAGEIFDGFNGFVSLVRGNYGDASLSFAAMAPIVGWAATAIKIQKHHIIPRAVYKKAGAAVQSVLDLDGGFNLKKIPFPFHGNHPQYSEFVTKRLQEMQNITPASIQALQKDLSSMINQAYDNYKLTGENLNDYFRKINGN